MAGRGVPPAPGGARWSTFDKKPGAAAGANRDGGSPSLIKCAVCKKVKNKEEFSNRQLLKFSSYNKGGRSFNKDPGSVHVTCTMCTASQTVELKCCVCDKMKGLDGFAKNQRKDPDNARCIKCVKADIETEPDLPPESGSEASSSDGEDEAHEWDTGAAKSAANKINPYRPENKKAACAQASEDDDNDDDDFEDMSSNASFSRAAALRQEGYNPRARPSASQRTPAVFNPRANQPSNSYAGRAAPTEDDDEWETLDNHSIKPIGGSYRAASTASPSGYSSQQTNVRKNGWGKVQKVPKGKEQKWGQVEDDAQDEENLWANYGRKK